MSLYIYQYIEIIINKYIKIIIIKDKWIWYLLPKGFWVLLPNKFVLGVELKAKLFVVVVAGVPKLVIGFPNNPLEPDCVVAPKPPLIAPKPNLRYKKKY